MIINNDSTITVPDADASGAVFSVSQEQTSYPIRHPYQVLRRLPKDATPAQQDSAIQSVFQPEEIHYSERPDTLHLPGSPIGDNILEAKAPESVYKESYFKNVSLYNPEIEAGRMGFAGDPIPYSAASDNVLTSIILSGVIITLLAAVKMKHFFYVELKEFFVPMKRNELHQKITSQEYALQFFLLIQQCFILSIIYFNHVEQDISDTFTVSSEYTVMAIYFGEVLGYIFLKYALQHWANKTLFPGSNTLKWNQSKLLLTSLMSIALIPALLLSIFFNLSLVFTLSYIILLYLTYEMLLFFKAFRIFFFKNTFKVQIFLYLCTLEIVPIIILWAVLSQTTQSLTITD